MEERHERLRRVLGLGNPGVTTVALASLSTS